MGGWGAGGSKSSTSSSICRPLPTVAEERGRLHWARFSWVCRRSTPCISTCGLPASPSLFVPLPLSGLCVPQSLDAGHTLTPSDGPCRSLKCPWPPRMRAPLRVGWRCGLEDSGSLRGCVRGTGTGLVSQEEGSGFSRVCSHEILRVQNGWGAGAEEPGLKWDGARESVPWR